MFGRLTAVSLASLTLVACGGGDKPDAETSTPINATQTAAPEMSKKDVKAAEAAEAETADLLTQLSADIAEISDVIGAEYEAYETDVATLSAQGGVDLSVIKNLPREIDTKIIRKFEKMGDDFTDDEDIVETLTDIIRRSNNYNEAVEGLDDFYPKSDVTEEQFTMAGTLHDSIVLRRGKLQESLGEMANHISYAQALAAIERVERLEKSGRLSEMNLHNRIIQLDAVYARLGIDTPNYRPSRVRRDACNYDVKTIFDGYPVDLSSDEAKDNLSRGQRKSARAMEAAMVGYYATYKEICALSEDGELDEETLAAQVKSLAKDYAKAKAAFADVVED